MTGYRPQATVGLETLRQKHITTSKMNLLTLEVVILDFQLLANQKPVCNRQPIRNDYANLYSVIIMMTLTASIYCYNNSSELSQHDG